MFIAFGSLFILLNLRCIETDMKNISLPKISRRLSEVVHPNALNWNECQVMNNEKWEKYLYQLYFIKVIIIE